MWMVHDLIKLEKKKRPEDVGAEYFEELVNASLLQKEEQKQPEDVDGRYTIHDLIHDLALLVSNEEFLLVSNGEFATTDDSLPIGQMDKVRHITIAAHDYWEIVSQCNIQKLLTLYTRPGYDSVLDEPFEELKSIRVLVLRNPCFDAVPDSTSELRHLWYLDVRKTEVQSLPYSSCYLYNLQMIAAPINYVDLPRDIVNIRSLRYVRACLSTCRGVRKLTTLQELSSIRICRGDNIRELVDLQLLRGFLTIEGLQNFTSSKDAAGALMEEKKHINELILKFDKEFAEPTISEELLDTLRCPLNLTYLQIQGYTSVKSPSWIVDCPKLEDRKHKFDKLQKLYLYDYPKLESLPPLREFDKPSTSLTITRCPKLVSVADFQRLSSLQYLHIQGYPKLQSLSPDFHKLSSLKKSHIYDCRQLKSLPPNFHKLSSLNSLNINLCPKLQSLPPDFHKLSSREELSIYRCPKLQPSSSDFHMPSSLKHLYIIPKEEEEILRDVHMQEEEEEILRNVHMQEEEKEEEILRDDDPYVQLLSSLEYLHIQEEEEEEEEEEEILRDDDHPDDEEEDEEILRDADP